MAKKPKATQNKAAKTETQLDKNNPPDVQKAVATKGTAKERIRDLKVKAYDLLALMDKLREELNQVNRQIAQESRQAQKQKTEVNKCQTK